MWQRDQSSTLTEGTRLLLIPVKFASITTLWPRFLLPCFFLTVYLVCEISCVGTYCQYMQLLLGSLNIAYFMASFFVLENQKSLKLLAFTPQFLALWKFKSLSPDLEEH